jgi:hypothetical protein
VLAPIGQVRGKALKEPLRRVQEQRHRRPIPGTCVAKLSKMLDLASAVWRTVRCVTH